VLRRRAEGFLRNAVRLVDEGQTDLAIFNLEQYCQLVLKYKLLIAKGTYVRTHSQEADKGAQRSEPQNLDVDQ